LSSTWTEDGFHELLARGKSPEAGAEVIVHLTTDDYKKYDSGSYWEFEDGEMRRVPW
jgi:hypothetical protein